MTLDKCIVLRIGTLTGCPPCRESQPLCRLKNPMVISIWLLVGFHPATRSLQSTPADNTRKRVWQYIEEEKKRKKEKNGRRHSWCFVNYERYAHLLPYFCVFALESIGMTPICFPRVDGTGPEWLAFSLPSIFVLQGRLFTLDIGHLGMLDESK